MSQEKRRKARVQGGWASSSLPVRSDDFRPKPALPPAWLGKNIDNPKEKPFVYTEQEKGIREKPKEQIVTKRGVYDIGSSSNGVSRIRLFPNFMDASEADWIYEQLYHEMPWKQRSDVKNDISYVQPRLTAWYGDLPYSYSGVTQEPNPNWHPVLVMLRDRLEETTGFIFNSMLANLYRDGHDSVDWHSDDERSLGNQPTIASLSFGDTRMFDLRKKPPEDEQGNYTYMEHVKVPLTHGSLLIMEGAIQEDWQHRVPKEYHDRKPRINLTFRMIYPE